MTVLTKLSHLVYSAGSPYVPGDPGSAYVPGHYASITTTVKTPVYAWALIYAGFVPPPGYVVADQFAVTSAGLWQLQLQGYTSQLVTSKYWVPAVPARAPTPPVAAVQPGVAADLNIGWNSNADSIALATGDFKFTFSVPASAVGVVAGLSLQREAIGYITILHGLYASHGEVLVVESGVPVSAPVDFAESDVLGIERRNGTVSYTKNAAPFKTSAAATSDPVSAVAAMYVGGDSVVGAALGALDALGASSTSMQPMTTSAFDGNHAQAYVSLEPLTSSANGRTNAGVACSLEPLQSFGADRATATSSTSLQPLTTIATGSGRFAPAYAVSYSSMAFMVAAGHMLTGGMGEADVSLRPLHSINADHPYGYAEVSFEPLISATGQLVPANTSSVAAPRATLYAVGHDSTGENAFAGTPPSAVLVAQGGANASISSPKPQLAITATVTNWGAASAGPPVALLRATGTVTGQAAAAMFAPMSTLVGYMGAVCSITGPQGTLQASGVTGAIGTAAITCPLFELVAGGAKQNHGGAELLAPGARMGATAQAWIMAPTAQLVAIGTATVAASYEAYALNLKHIPQPNQIVHDELTHYTNYPFQRIVRWKNSYFGMAADGLYLLEGTTDYDPTAPSEVAWAWQTAITDFDESRNKMIIAGYYAGRFPAAATLSVLAGEGTPNAYAYATPRGAAARNHRQVFGKGICALNATRGARYYAFAGSGQGEMELASIEFNVATLARRV